MLCACCGQRIEIVDGVLVDHDDGGWRCPGSGQVVAATAFGPVDVMIPLGQTQCVACGQRAEVLTVHDEVNAVWPCGHAFPARQAEAPGVTVPLPRADSVRFTAISGTHRSSTV